MARLRRRPRVPVAQRDADVVAVVVGRKRRRDWGNWVGAAGVVFVALGLFVLAVVAYRLWGTGIQEARAQRDLRQRFDHMLSSTVPTNPAVPMSIVPGATARPDGRSSTDPVPLPGRRTTEPSPTVPTPDEPSSHPEIKNGDPVARLQIPAIGVDKVVVSGVLTGDLEHGPGHYPATPLPGELGNAGIAGHRTTYGSPFSDLDQLQPGDQIIVTTTAGRFRFDVIGAKIVEPTDASVLAPTSDTRLTLTTCDPRYSTAHRLIVTAVLDPRPPDEPVATTAAATTRPTVTATTGASATGGDRTTIPAPSTTVGDTTTVTTPTTTTPPPSSPTTATPMTATPPTTGVEQLVADAYLASWPRYWACVRDPTSCAPDDLTAQQGTARQTLTTTVDELRAQGWYVGNEDPGYAVIATTVVDVVAHQATVSSCVWDTEVLYGPPTVPGGPATVVNDLPISRMYEHDLYLEDGTWKIGAQRELSHGPPGSNLCPPRP